MPFEETLPIIKIAFLDVGQGDTVVISCTDTHEAIVVDCVDAKAVLNYLKQEEIMHLRGVIITHLHADHYKDVASLLYNCSEVLGVQGCEVLACNEIINPRDLKNPKTLQKLKPDADGHSSVYEQPSVGTKKLPSSSLAKLFLWCQQNKLKCEPIRVTQSARPSLVPWQKALICCILIILITLN